MITSLQVFAGCDSRRIFLIGHLIEIQTGIWLLSFSTHGVPVRISVTEYTMKLLKGARGQLVTTVWPLQLGIVA